MIESANTNPFVTVFFSIKILVPSSRSCRTTGKPANLFAKQKSISLGESDEVRRLVGGFTNASCVDTHPPKDTSTAEAKITSTGFFIFLKSRILVPPISSQSYANALGIGSRDRKRQTLACSSILGWRKFLPLGPALPLTGAWFWLPPNPPLRLEARINLLQAYCPEQE
jgi:hypothetical protein